MSGSVMGMLRNGGRTARTTSSGRPAVTRPLHPSTPWTRGLEAAVRCKCLLWRRGSGWGPAEIHRVLAVAGPGRRNARNLRPGNAGGRQCVWPMRRSSSSHCRRRCRQPWSVAAVAAGIRRRLRGLQGGAPTCKIVGGAGIFSADSEVMGGLALGSDDFALIGTCMPATGWTATGKLRRNAVELVMRTPMGAPTLSVRFVVRRQNSA